MKTSVKAVLIILIIFKLNACQGQETPTNYSEKEAFYQKRLAKYLLKSSELDKQIIVADSGIALYDEEQTLEYFLDWQQTETFANLLKAQPKTALEYYQKGHPPPENSLKIDEVALPPKKENRLDGWKIALDPGHFAGNFQEAKMEGKFISMNFQGRHISFYESRLAWFTAKILKDTLEQLGAEVILTRDAFGNTAFDKSYTEWFKEFTEKQKKLGKNVNNPQSVFFKVFRKMEFNERVRKINNFAPHLTLVIHYNVDAANTGWTKPSAHNHSMAFVGGSFMKGELEKQEARFNLLRLLLSDDFENSLNFSNKILQGIELRLGIKPVPAQNNQLFLKKFCRPTPKKGVYARNLTLARKVHGTICYAEPLYQDNIKELARLNEKSFTYDETKVPHRLKEVAEAYLLGILNYANNR